MATAAAMMRGPAEARPDVRGYAELAGGRVLALATHETTTGAVALLYVEQDGRIELAARGVGDSLELACEALRADLRARRAAA
jgi:hypothetical protein